MDLPAPLAWLVDEAGASPGADRFLADLGSRLLADGLPLAGGALTLAVPHPIIARRTWLWRAETGIVIEALGFADAPPDPTGRDWLTELGPVQQHAAGGRRTVPCWVGPQLGRSAPPRAAGCARPRALPWRRWPRSRDGWRWRRCSRPISAAAAPLESRPAHCAAAPGRRSAPRCSAPICATSPCSPRRPSRRR